MDELLGDIIDEHDKIVLGYCADLKNNQVECEHKTRDGIDNIAVPSAGKESIHPGLFCVPKEKLARHTVIVAQSGAGKSFFLGTFLEEILLRTPARVTIVDPNSDFRFFMLPLLVPAPDGSGVPAPYKSIYKRKLDDAYEPKPPAPYDNNPKGVERFEKRWSTVQSGTTLWGRFESENAIREPGEREQRHEHDEKSFVPSFPWGCFTSDLIIQDMIHPVSGNHQNVRDRVQAIHEIVKLLLRIAELSNSAAELSDPPSKPIPISETFPKDWIEKLVQVHRERSDNPTGGGKDIALTMLESLTSYQPRGSGRKDEPNRSRANKKGASGATGGEPTERELAAKARQDEQDRLFESRRQELAKRIRAALPIGDPVWQEAKSLYVAQHEQLVKRGLVFYPDRARDVGGSFMLADYTHSNIPSEDSVDDEVLGAPRVDGNAARRLDIIDLPSLEIAGTKHETVLLTLERLWIDAQVRWSEQASARRTQIVAERDSGHLTDLDRPDDKGIGTSPAATARAYKDPLRAASSEPHIDPHFIVIDEAHNVMPADAPDTWLKRAIREKLAQIAAEGRKYGLFLIIVTQRPDKLDPRVLSECANHAIMMLKAPAALDACDKSFGINLSRQDRVVISQKMTKGFVRISGEWASAEPARASPYLYSCGRRTNEGGVELRHRWWNPKSITAPVATIKVDPSGGGAGASGPGDPPASPGGNVPTDGGPSSGSEKKPEVVTRPVGNPGVKPGTSSGPGERDATPDNPPDPQT